jgi:hypothetical protein
MDQSSVETNAENRSLANKLMRLTADTQVEALTAQSERAPHDADAIVTHIEVNDFHGVGVLVGRLFGQSGNVVSIRSKDFYAGHQEFGTKDVCISHGETTRDVVFRNVLQALQGTTVKRVLCIPYFTDDALNAIALSTIFGAPLCTYIMDDQNLSTDGIPDSIMAELLERSSLRLAISPALHAGYQQKYGHRMSFMPPLVPSRFIPTEMQEPPGFSAQVESAVMIGNIWGQRWTELLRQTVRDSCVTLRWYNNGDFPWLPCSKEELAADGIIPQEGPPHPDKDLIQILRDAPFVVVPSGVLDETDDRGDFARLSLPSRIPYIFATSHTPILVLGSPDTAAARFVTTAGLGMAVPYERIAFQEAVEHVLSPRVNREIRQAAFRLSHRFTDHGAAEWIWRSLAVGEPIDGRYEELMAPMGG